MHVRLQLSLRHEGIPASHNSCITILSSTTHVHGDILNACFFPFRCSMAADTHATRRREAHGEHVSHDVKVMLT